VGIRFNYSNTSFVFLNCHLTSGQKEVNGRISDLKEVYTRSFDGSLKYQDYIMEDHDYKFLFGDLNFRIDMSYEETIE